MNFKKRFKRDMRDIKTPEIGRVLPGIAGGTEGGKHHRKFHRTVIVPLAIMLCCIFIISAAATAIPAIIRYLNAQVLTENNTRLTEVPEGWVGIYTVEDLNNIRNNSMKTNYILMSDITFTEADYAAGGICEGGWKPIGRHEEFRFSGDRYHSYYALFTGQFNGNGYVIRNLKINEGSVDENSDNIYAGLFGCTYGHFRNLGIENCEINITDGTRRAFIGAVAGQSSFIGGCYVTNLTVNATITATSTDSNNNNDITFSCVGGLGGYVKYVDSCYVYADINVTGGAENETDICIGGIAGMTYSCVTSYFIGDIISGDSCRISPITVSGAGTGMPVLLSEEAMNKINDKLAGYYGYNTYSYKKFYAYYLRKSVDNYTTDEAKAACAEDIRINIEMNYYTDDVSGITSWYLFDPTASLVENYGIAEIAIEAFGGYDNFQAFCLENHVKCGILYCYSFDSGTELKESDLYAFNFDTIWVIKKGQALLKIFES